MNFKYKTLLFPLLSTCMLGTTFADSNSYFSADLQSSEGRNFINFVAHGYCGTNSLFNNGQNDAECEWKTIDTDKDGDEHTDSGDMHNKLKSMGMGLNDEGDRLTQLSMRYKNSGIKAVFHEAGADDSCLYSYSVSSSSDLCIKTRDYGTNGHAETICNIKSNRKHGHLRGIELVVSDFYLPENLPDFQTFFNPGSLSRFNLDGLSKSNRKEAITSFLNANGTNNAGQYYDQLMSFVDTNTSSKGYTLQDYNGYYGYSAEDIASGDAFLTGFMCFVTNTADRIYIANKDDSKYYNVTFLDSSSNELSTINGDSDFKVGSQYGISIPAIVGTVATVHIVKQDNDSKTMDLAVSTENASFLSNQTYKYLDDSGQVQSATSNLTTGMYVTINSN